MPAPQRPGMGQDQGCGLQYSQTGTRRPTAPVGADAGGPALLITSAVALWWMVWPANPFAPAPAVGPAWGGCCCFRRAALRRVSRKQAATVILAGSVLLGLAAMSAPPRTSNDSARYAWDGIVQKAGISPYSHVPRRRDAFRLCGPAGCSAGLAGHDGQPVCTGGLIRHRFRACRGVSVGRPLCTAINRPYVPTIYPPTAEIYFLGVRWAVSGLSGLPSFPARRAADQNRRYRPAAQRTPPGRAAAAPGRRVGLEPVSCSSRPVNNAHVDVLGGALLVAAGIAPGQRKAAPLRRRFRGRCRHEIHPGHRGPRTTVQTARPFIAAADAPSCCFTSRTS